MESSLREELDDAVPKKRARVASTPEPGPFTLRGDTLRCVLQLLPLKGAIAARLVSKEFARQGALLISEIILMDGDDFPAAMTAFTRAKFLFLLTDKLTFVPEHPGRARITRYTCRVVNTAISMLFPNLQHLDILGPFSESLLNCIPPYITSLKVKGVAGNPELFDYVNIARRFPNLQHLTGVALSGIHVLPFLEHAPHIESAKIAWSHDVLQQVLLYPNNLSLRFKTVRIFPTDSEQFSIQLLALCRFSKLETLELKVNNRMAIAESVRAQFVASSLNLKHVWLCGGGLQMVVYFASPRIESLCIEPKFDSLSFDHLILVAPSFPNLEEVILPSFEISDLQVERLRTAFPKLRRLGVGLAKLSKSCLAWQRFHNFLAIFGKIRGLR